MLVNKPPMGWNTWNTFGLEPSDQLVRENVDAFIELGLKDYGYEYIVVDDFWSKYYRNPETNLIEPDPVKFPYGMKDLADYIHARGLKFGMYSCTGTRTCGDFPGSFDHEYQDAQQLADWGVDFLKYDFCYKPAGTDGMLLYRRMAMALRATGRDILFNACNWGSDDVWSWIRSTGAHMYRSTGDIHDCSESYRKIVLSQLDKLGTSAPQCFNDLDMLTVGMYGTGLVGTDCISDSTDADYRSQFSLWCMCSAPLFLGCDIRKMNETTYKLVTNRRLLAINQDPECRPPLVIPHNWNDKVKILVKNLADGTYAVGFYNFEDKRDMQCPLVFADMGLPFHSGYDLEMECILGGDEKRTYREYMNVTIPAHDVKLYIAKLVKR